MKTFLLTEHAKIQTFIYVLKMKNNFYRGLSVYCVFVLSFACPIRMDYEFIVIILFLRFSLGLFNKVANMKL